MKNKAAVLAVEDRVADDVRGQKVARKLDAAELHAQRLGQGLREGGLANARDIFDQKVATRDEAHDGQPDRLFFTDDHLPELGSEMDDAASHM